MSKTSSISTPLQKRENLSNFEEMSAFDLRLITKKINIKFSSYKISTLIKNMFETESIAISTKGILFPAETNYEKGTLLRVWVEIPDYWTRKSQHVEYRHTKAPSHFQILTKVVGCGEQFTQSNKYHVLCENLNMDAIDESILEDYLASSSGAISK